MNGASPVDARYYGPDLARIHHQGFSAHAEDGADAVLAQLEPLRARDGVVLELGCGSGVLTRRLVEAGHRVIATDASESMLAIARDVAPDAEIRRLTLPDDPLPVVDAIVSVGHTLNYLPEAHAVTRSLGAICAALRPHGVLALDLCDLRWASSRRDQPPRAHLGDDWAVITVSSVPSRDRYVRDITMFTANGDGSWRRSHERHENVLIDTSAVPALLADHGMDATVWSRMGSYELPDGMVWVTARRRA